MKDPRLELLAEERRGLKIVGLRKLMLLVRGARDLPFYFLPTVPPTGRPTGWTLGPPPPGAQGKAPEGVRPPLRGWRARRRWTPSPRTVDRPLRLHPAFRKRRTSCPPLLTSAPGGFSRQGRFSPALRSGPLRRRPCGAGLPRPEPGGARFQRRPPASARRAAAFRLQGTASPPPSPPPFGSGFSALSTLV